MGKESAAVQRAASAVADNSGNSSPNPSSTATVISAVPITEEDQETRVWERALHSEIKCEVLADQLRNTAKHRARSTELHLQKRKFVNLAETTKTGPVETELANDRIGKYSKMIEEMQAAHEKSCRPCSEATFMKLDAVLDLAERLIPLSEEADQVALALYRSRLDQIANEVISSPAAAMLLEGQTLGRLLRCPEDMSRTSSSGLSGDETVMGQSRSPSPEPVQRNRKARRSAGIAKAKPNFDPRPRTSASASRGLQSIKGLTPIPSQDPEDLFESDSESTCSRCSLRGKCPAQDGVCDGQTAEEVD